LHKQLYELQNLPTHSAIENHKFISGLWPWISV